MVEVHAPDGVVPGGVGAGRGPLEPGPLESCAARALPGDEWVSHAWMGLVGPRPATLSLLSCMAVAAVFAHLALPLPAWWPYAIGGVAIVFNLALAYWQAGSCRIVAVTGSGIHVLRKARWSSRCTHLVGSMPRMPLGPLAGRWCEVSIANTVMWVHRTHHRTVEAFDREFRGRLDPRRTVAGGPMEQRG